MAKHFDDEHIKLTLEQGIISVEYSEGRDDWAFGFEHLGELIKNLQRAQAWLKEQEKKKEEPKIPNEWRMLDGHCRYLFQIGQTIFDFGTKCPLPEKEFWDFCEHFGYEGVCLESKPVQWQIRQKPKEPESICHFCSFQIPEDGIHACYERKA
jgi:hypothetical protein